MAPLVDSHNHSRVLLVAVHDNHRYRPEPRLSLNQQAHVDHVVAQKRLLKVSAQQISDGYAARTGPVAPRR